MNKLDDMLKDKFFSIKERTQDEGTYKFAILLNKDHQVYEGHFPAMPVVPGVCTLQMTKECAEEVIGEKLRYTEISNCKFSAMIVPTQTQEVEVALTIQPEAEMFVVKATVKTQEANFLTLKATLIKENQ
ncbi:MAG: hypothetical protein J6Y37_07430 [Paludibacteraceae bacterium]|nr:hypothetical protein [Paludibacteraceae bacterium]